MCRSIMTAAMVAPLLLAGCSGGVSPRINASSQRALDASLMAIDRSLNAEKKKQFRSACLFITSRAIVPTPYLTAPDGLNQEAPETFKAYEEFDEMTADQFLGRVKQKRGEVARKQEATARNRPSMDHDVIATKGKEAMRKAVAPNVGTEAAERALITADPAHLKEFGDSAWEVHGFYTGLDKEGVKFKATWTVRLEWQSGELVTTSAKMGERQALPPPALALEEPKPPAPDRVVPRAEPKGEAVPKTPDPREEARKTRAARVAEIYPIAKKKYSDARARGARGSSSSARKTITKRETEAATAFLCRAYKLTADELKILMIEGEMMEERENPNKVASKAG